MRARIDYWKSRLRSSFWLVPTAMTSAALAMALIMLGIDAATVGTVTGGWQDAFAVGPEGARLVLSTIAGSMISVASLVFSMTLVALTLAASSIGPRVLDRYMANWVNQVALGLFLATFVYALIVLCAVRGGDPPFVPRLALGLALALAILSFGWLIYFIHELAASIQVDNAIASVGRGLLASLEDRARDDEPPRQGPDRLPEPDPGSAVTADGSGYVQTVDTEALCQAAIDHDVLIVMDIRPGDFLLPTSSLGRVAGLGTPELADAIRAAVVLGPRRTPAQDLKFSINLLVEIAARALSPGVNDYFTALACIDHLAAVLARVLADGMPDPRHADGSGRLRLVLRPVTAIDLVDAVFSPLRQMARNSLPVQLRMIEVLTMLTASAGTAGERDRLRHHGELIADAARRDVDNEVDLQAIESHCERLAEAAGS